MRGDNLLTQSEEIEYTEADELYCGDSWINDLTRDTIIENTTFERLLQIADPMERKRMIAKVTFRASDLRCTNKFKELLKEYQMQRAKQQPRELAKGHELTDFAELGLGGLLLDCGAWNVSESGVYKVSVDSNGNQKTVQASPVPIVPTKLIKNVESGAESVELAFKIGEKKHVVTCARSDIADKNKIVRLSDMGVFVTSDTSKDLVKYLNDCIALNIGILPQSRSISRLGWYEEKFIGYPCDIEFSGTAQLKNALSQKGSPKEWSDCIKAQIESSLEFRLLMAASFASPLIELLGVLPFIVHLWGTSGTGKSIAVKAAASVWGDPSGAMYISMNNTINFMQVRAAGLRNLPFCADELQTVKCNKGKDKPKNYDDFIMIVTEGKERGALNTDRTEKNVRDWHNAFLTTGEEPIVKSISSGAGAYNRVIQLQVNENIFKDFGYIADTVKNNYGWAGLDFIMHIKNPDKIEEMKRIYTDHLNRILEISPTTGKQAAALALLLTADEIADKLIYKSDKRLSESDIVRYASLTEEVSTAVRARECILNKIAMHRNDFIGVYEDPKTGDIQESHGHQPTGRIFGKITKEKTTKEDVVYINKSVLIEWLEEATFDFDAVKCGWADSGFLIKNSAGRFNCNPPKGLTGTYVKLKLH